MTSTSEEHVTFPTSFEASHVYKAESINFTEGISKRWVFPSDDDVIDGKDCDVTTRSPHNHVTSQATSHVTSSLTVSPSVTCMLSSFLTNEGVALRPPLGESPGSLDFGLGFGLGGAGGGAFFSGVEPAEDVLSFSCLPWSAPSDSISRGGKILVTELI